ncbi:MAG: hypothetical protein EOP83_23910 [Verrucomicrobiaceae bacterium]|nr:MAG: hypothetical protein EOP83_23910 [Verrucomicrobiaceae bacterium]
MPLYHFRQNNSGGSFHTDRKKGIGPNVYIAAETPEKANFRAVEIGIYFDGAGDCECCGARWSSASQWDETEKVDTDKYTFNYHDEVYVHDEDPAKGFRIISKPE